jgi:hypothetical protein
MTQNPDSLDWNGEQEYEYVYTIDTTALSDASHTVQATAYPNTGTEHALDDRIIQVWNSGSPSSWYVDGTLGSDTTGNGSTGSPWATLNKACTEATGGDTIYVRAGTYAFPDQSGYAFTKFVTITPDTGVDRDDVLLSFTEAYIRSNFLKFVNCSFYSDRISTGALRNSLSHHFWVHRCKFTGIGRDYTGSPYLDAYFIRMARSTAEADGTDGEHCTATECECSDIGTFIAVGISTYRGYGHHIIRGNYIHHCAADAMNYEGYDILISGNKHQTNTKPQGAVEPTQHCDHIQSNMAAEQVVIRNNLLYDGKDQGNKFGGFANIGFGYGMRTQVGGVGDGEDYMTYEDIALLNNVYHLNTSYDTVNLRFEGYATYKTFSNILIEHNSFVNGSTTFTYHEDVEAADVVIRNNILYGGAVDTGPVDGFTFSNNHWTGDDDPLLVDPANGDFTIGALSPCRSAGTAGASTRDIRSYDRHPTTPDLGAYEYQDYDAVPDYTTMIVLGIRS